MGPFWGVVLKPVGEFRVPRPVRRGQFVKDGLRPLAPWAFHAAAVGTRLKVLRCIWHWQRYHAAPGSAAWLAVHSGMVVRYDVLDPAHAEGDKVVEELAPVDLRLREYARHPSKRRLPTDGSSPSGTTLIAVRTATSWTRSPEEIRGLNVLSSNANISATGRRRKPMKKSKMKAKESKCADANTKSAEDRINEAEEKFDSEMMNHLTKKIWEKRQEMASASNILDIEKILQDSAHEAGVWINVIDNGAASGLDPDDSEPLEDIPPRYEQVGLTNAESCSKTDSMVGTMFCPKLLTVGKMTDELKYEIAVLFSCYRVCGLTAKQAIERLRIIFSSQNIDPDEIGIMEAIAEAQEADHSSA